MAVTWSISLRIHAWAFRTPPVTSYVTPVDVAKVKMCDIWLDTTPSECGLNTYWYTVRACPNVKDGCVRGCKMEGADYILGEANTEHGTVPHRGLGQLVNESSHIMLCLAIILNNPAGKVILNLLPIGHLHSMIPCWITSCWLVYQRWLTNNYIHVFMSIQLGSRVTAMAAMATAEVLRALRIPKSTKRFWTCRYIFGETCKIGTIHTSTCKAVRRQLINRKIMKISGTGWPWLTC